MAFSSALITVNDLHDPQVKALPPGSHIILFGCDVALCSVAARAKGWEVRDTLLILLPGPKAQTAVLLRKPLAEERPQQVLHTRTGALNIDGCRVPGLAKVPRGRVRAYRVFHDGKMDSSAMKEPPPPHPLGRFPPNVVLVHTPECRKEKDWKCTSRCPRPQLDAFPADEPASVILPQFANVLEMLDWMKRLVTPAEAECFLGYRDVPHSLVDFV